TAGTVDLRQRMEALTTDSGARRGRIVDVSTKNGTPDGQDYANTLGLAFAPRGLAEAGSAEAPAALGYLLQQQCPGGGFRLAFPAPSAAQACTSKSAGAVDATSIAVAEIAQLPVTDATTRAIYRARAWLRGQQRVDGSFDGGTGTPGSNSNTTGLAAVALGTGDAAEAASTWVARRQVPAGQTGALAADKGAIAYDDAAKNAAATNGIGSAAADRDQWDRATAQAAGALLVVNPAHRALGLTGPSGYQRAGSTVTLDGSGLLAGRTAQLSGTGLSAYRTSTSSTWQQRVTLPAGTATRRYVLGEDTGLSAARSIKVLGTKKLAVAVSRYRVRRSHYVTATVSGLASGEKATISYRGSRVRSGAASTSGTFKATFRVGRSLGRKAVVGVGQFTDIRRGTGYVRVVR
ncbi:MAG: hypothetical protein JWR20_441, partial [Marmoricola sp.]|nr:hypothetical protein [Marmoricola sp.]